MELTSQHFAWIIRGIWLTVHTALRLTLPAQGQTMGGNSNGFPCLFPFTYEGKSYSSCITVNHNNPWCATTDNYDKDKLWGECTAEALDNLPSFDQSQSQKTVVTAGETAVLPCTVTNLQYRKVTWQLRGSPFPVTIGTSSFMPGARFRVQRDGIEQWDLVIRDAERRDSGFYQCRVTTRSMLLVREVELVVKDRPMERFTEISLSGKERIFIEMGKRLLIQCNVTEAISDQHDEFSFKVEWWKNGENLSAANQKDVVITNQIHERTLISTLTIARTTVSDGGLYICRSEETNDAVVEVKILNTKKMPQDEPHSEHRHSNHSAQGTNVNRKPYMQEETTKLPANLQTVVALRGSEDDEILDVAGRGSQATHSFMVLLVSTFYYLDHLQ